MKSRDKYNKTWEILKGQNNSIWKARDSLNQTTRISFNFYIRGYLNMVNASAKNWCASVS